MKIFVSSTYHINEEELSKMEEAIKMNEFIYTGYPRDFATEKAIADRLIFYLKIGITNLKQLKKYNKEQPK